MADRTTFLQNIQAQAAKGRAYRVAVNPNATAAEAYVGGGPDPVATLLKEWIGVGGQGTRVHGREGLQRALAEFFAHHQVKSAIYWNHPVLERWQIPQLLSESGIAGRSWGDLEQQAPADRWSAALSADLGITSVDWAVAETGTLALCSQPGQGRAVSLVTPLYIAIVEPSQVIPDLFDLFQALEPRKDSLPSNLVLVTGPSKTGDIEQKLTTGVHGPGTVFLIVVE